MQASPESILEHFRHLLKDAVALAAASLIHLPRPLRNTNRPSSSVGSSWSLHVGQVISHAAFWDRLFLLTSTFSPFIHVVPFYD